SAEPVRVRPYRWSAVVSAELNKQIDELLKKGYIRPSNSFWSCSPVMVSKQTGDWRFCVDFRPINRYTQIPAHPLPNMLRVLSALHHAVIISTMDLKEAFHQILMAEESIPLTAFAVEGRGQIEWVRMPYGLAGAPATFQKAMDNLKERYIKLIIERAFAYLDDWVIISGDLEEHKGILALVFEVFREAGLQINPNKCKFARSEVKFLGFIVDKDGLRPDPEKIAPVINFPRPTNRKQPLSIPKPDLPYVLYTDASDTGLGAFLVQKGTDSDKEYLIICLSRPLRGAETRYTTTEKECLAVVWAVRKLRCYLEGTPFTVVTDHASLKWLHSLKDPNGRLARWAMELLSNHITIEHRRGTENEGPDALLRLYEDQE
ncbi:GSCOCG00011798001-RA-CDS, partial [Cotesia congregata]